MGRTLLLLASRALAALLAGRAALAAVEGTTITVNSEGDGTKTGNCTLREAIEAANTNARVDGCRAGSAAERDAVRFSLGERATIVLASELSVADPAGLNINGQKAKITVSGNDAARVLRVSPGASLNLNRLTVTGGSGTFGGGIFNQEGTLEMTNSTLSANSASYGGGIDNFGAATFRNTIVADSPSGGNCSGDAPTDGGYNMEDGDSCSFSEANNSMPSTDPLLADALAHNGGPTRTLALQKGSPAINAIPRATNGCGTQVEADQRGVARPQGAGCDVGAFEKKRKKR